MKRTRVVALRSLYRATEEALLNRSWSRSMHGRRVFSWSGSAPKNLPLLRRLIRHLARLAKLAKRAGVELDSELSQEPALERWVVACPVCGEAPEVGEKLCGKCRQDVIEASGFGDGPDGEEDGHA